MNDTRTESQRLYDRWANNDRRRKHLMKQARKVRRERGAVTKQVLALVRLARRANWNAMNAKRELMGLEVHP